MILVITPETNTTVTGQNLTISKMVYQPASHKMSGHTQTHWKDTSNLYYILAMLCMDKFPLLNFFITQ